MVGSSFSLGNPTSPVKASSLLSWAALLILLCFTYGPSLSGGFIWDDGRYVSQNRTLTDPHGLEKIWFQPGATPQYYPLVFTSFYFEHKLWGFNPFGYRALNLIFHFLNGFLLFLLLRRLSIPGAFLAAILFLFHPVHVESVAWISERKNTLSGFFALLSLLFYFSEDRPEKKIGKGAFSTMDVSYWASFFLFIAALLSKTVTAVLPAVMIVIQWLKGESITKTRLIRLAPFFAAGGILVTGTIIMESHVVGTKELDFALSFLDRILLASRSVLFYAGKVFWPYPTMFNYPRWTHIGGSAIWFLAPLSLVGLLALLAWKMNSWGKGPLAAVIIFIIGLSPALGFIDFFPMKFSYVADHFQYLPSVALIALASAGAALFWRRVESRNSKLLLTGLAAVVIGIFVFLSRQQSRAYEGLEPLWRDTIAKNPGSLLANMNLGAVHVQKGRYLSALPHLEMVVREEPRNFYARTSLGVAHTYLSQPVKAIEIFEDVLAAEGRYVQAKAFYGQALLHAGQTGRAKAQFNEIIHAIPSYLLPHIWRVQAWMAEGNFVQAGKSLQFIRETWPKNSGGFLYTGVLLVLESRLDEAVPFLDQALEMGPGDRFMVQDLAAAYRFAGQEEKADAVFEIMAERQPTWEFLEVDRMKSLREPPSFSFQQKILK